MKTGLHFRTNHDGSKFILSPGKIKTGGITMVLNEEIEIDFSSNDVAADDINYIVIQSALNETIVPSLVKFETTEPAQESDGYLYTQYGPVYKRVIGAFPGLSDDDRFPMMGQNGQEFWYNEHIVSDLDSDSTINGWGYWDNAFKPGTGSSKQVQKDLKNILPTFVEAVDIAWGLRIVSFDGTEEADLWARPKDPGARTNREGIKIFQINNPSDSIDENAAQEAGPFRTNIKLGTSSEKELEIELTKQNGTFDSSDEFSISAFIMGWSLPWNLAEGQK